MLQVYACCAGPLERNGSDVKELVMRFLPAETAVLGTIAALGAIDIVLIGINGIDVDVPGYSLVILVGLALLAGGQFYRYVRKEEPIASAAIAAGSFVLFSIVGSAFNYMFLPIRFAPIDPLLMQVDAMLGYHWPAFVGWAAESPWIGTSLYFIYFTSLPQLLGLILFLGFSGRTDTLHRFLLTGVLGALLSIGFWIFFPTFGAKAYDALPASVLSAIPLAVDPAYGAELVRLGREGVLYLSPKNILGLIGFPSFHIVMACMSVYFAMQTRFLFPIFAVLNALMLPAVLVQGGHHLTDIFGGMAAFAIALGCANAGMRILSAPQSQTTPIGTREAQVNT
ncbi:phosphatase PAP2 family protein [Ensifer sp. MJa1]|uniref:phosphatase PAP2 family protein n=1 Tax=Ensifer sp. MJa1 TaxID=2919888 RepID=UPI0030085CB0